MSDLDKAIDTALHPERNGLLIKNGISEGASHEHIVKNSIKELIAAQLADQKQRFVEAIPEKKNENPIDYELGVGFDVADVTKPIENAGWNAAIDQAKANLRGEL